MTVYRLHLYRDRARLWRWRVFASNGKKVASSGEGYRRARNCRAMAAKLFLWLKDGTR